MVEEKQRKLKIDLVTTQSKAVQQAGNIARTSAVLDPCSRAFYHPSDNHTIIKLHTLTRELKKGWNKFVHEFADAITHEVLHACIAEERNNDAKYKGWYDSNLIPAKLAEEKIVYTMTGTMKEEEVYYKLLQAMTFKAEMYQIEYLTSTLKLRTFMYLLKAFIIMYAGVLLVLLIRYLL